MPTRYLTVLPVYNERPHVLAVLEQVRRYSPQILVVDDGSTDGTAEELAQEPGIELIVHPQNRGYGAALQSGFQFAIEHGYEVLVTIDCDGQHQPRMIPDFVARVFPNDQEPLDIVSGSRYLQEFPGDNQAPEERRRINQTITQLLNQRLGLQLTDSFCGFKAYRVAALERLRVTEMGYAMPIPIWVQVVKLGLRVEELAVPRIYLEEERSFGGSLDDAQKRMSHYLEVLEREIAAAFPPASTQACCENVASPCSEFS